MKYLFTLITLIVILGLTVIVGRCVIGGQSAAAATVTVTLDQYATYASDGAVLDVQNFDPELTQKQRVDLTMSASTDAGVVLAIAGTDLTSAIKTDRVFHAMAVDGHLITKNF